MRAAPLGSGAAAGASLKVDLVPNVGAWRIGPNGTVRSDLYQQNGLTAPSVALYFTTVAGYISPQSPATIALASGQLTTVTATYHGITAQPPDRNVDTLASTTFGVSVSGTPVSYRWRRNGVNLTNGVNANGTTVNGATAATLTLTNLKPAGAGNYSVVVTWDNGAMTSSPGALEVRTVMDVWRTQYFTLAEQADPLVSGPAADAGKDGVNLLLAYALNLHPKNNDARNMTPGIGTFGLPAASRQSVSGQPRLALEFVRRRTASSPGISYQVEFTGNLSNGASWSGTGTETSVTSIDSTWERVLVTDTLPATPGRFGRLRISAP